MTHSAVILAAGLSTRMGRDKAMIEVAGESLLTRQIKLASASGAAEVFISGSADVDYTGFDCPVLHDRFPGHGPLAGIERALASIATTRLLVLAVDLPAMICELLQRIGNVGPGDAGAIPRVNGRIEPLAAFYPKTAVLLAESLLLAGNNSVAGFAERCVQTGMARFADLPATDAPHFINWNSPEDMSESRSGSTSPT
ncbi:MAG: molybdenum cofactor guanylyltransferase [Terracidiphilus sp.]